MDGVKKKRLNARSTGIYRYFADTSFFIAKFEMTRSHSGFKEESFDKDDPPYRRMSFK